MWYTTAVTGSSVTWTSSTQALKQVTLYNATALGVDTSNNLWYGAISSSTITWTQATNLQGQVGLVSL